LCKQCLSPLAALFLFFSSFSACLIVDGHFENGFFAFAGRAAGAGTGKGFCHSDFEYRANLVQPPGPPYPPETQSLGGVPSIIPDVPISAALLFIFIAGAVCHVGIFKLNRKRGKKFILSMMVFGTVFHQHPPSSHTRDLILTIGLIQASACAE
jgi:hypothetical protein